MTEDTLQEAGRGCCTWGASAGLSDGELLMGCAAIAAGLAGKDGRLCQSLRQRRADGVRQSEDCLVDTTRRSTPKATTIPPFNCTQHYADFSRKLH